MGGLAIFSEVKNLIPSFIRLLSNKIINPLHCVFPIATSPDPFLSEPSPRALSDYVVTGKPSLDRIGWQLVTGEQFEEPGYLRWCKSLHTSPAFQRKQWEWIYILQVLDSHGVLKENSRGLVFGCGKEPLPAVMARMGSTIVATDLASEDAKTTGWTATNEHSARLDDLVYPEICGRNTFLNRVSFRPCNMNQIPEDLTGFDFLWSSCSLEHLGSLDNGLRFIENSMRCLRPEGIAVHTTEFNLGSNGSTIENKHICIYRKRDVEALAIRLLAQGHKIGMINFTPGSSPIDNHADLPPYKSHVHFRLILNRHLITSIGIFVRRGVNS